MELERELELRLELVELNSREQEQAPEAVVEGQEQAPEAVVDLQGWEAPEALVEVLLVSEAGPQVREALGVLDQLLSCCVRRLDTIVQVGTGRALLGRQQMEERLSLLVVQQRLGLRG